MSKNTVSVKVCWDQVQPVDEFDLANVEICECHDPNYIEIHIKDHLGRRREGARFDRQEFIDHILTFYKSRT